MFTNFKRKLNSVIQEGIIFTENVSQNLKVPSSPKFDFTNFHTKNETSTKPKIPASINLYAGSEILQKNENDWSSIHNLNEENAEKARIIDDKIIKLKNSSDKTLTDLTDLYVSLTAIPNVIINLNNCVEMLSDISIKCQNLEKKLFDLEDLMEVLELQEKQLDKRFEMALYKEKKLGLDLKICFNIFFLIQNFILAALENVRKDLVSNHASSVQEFENNLMKIQHERQLVFQDAFQNDLKTFKEIGKIPSKYLFLMIISISS